MELTRRAEMINMLSESLNESVKNYAFALEESGGKPWCADTQKEDTKSAITRRAVEMRSQLNALIKDMEVF